MWFVEGNLSTWLIPHIWGVNTAALRSSSLSIVLSKIQSYFFPISKERPDEHFLYKPGTVLSAENVSPQTLTDCFLKVGHQWGGGGRRLSKW